MKLIEEDRSSVSKDCFAHLVSDSDLKDAQNGATPKKKKTLTRTFQITLDVEIKWLRSTGKGSSKQQQAKPITIEEENSR